jgi:hypothetical protein
MSNYLFSQFDTKQFGQRREASLKVSANSPKVSDNGDKQIARTEGSATLSDFSVAPQNRSQATSFSSLRELSQGRNFQMIKIGN